MTLPLHIDQTELIESDLQTRTIYIGMEFLGKTKFQFPMPPISISVAVTAHENVNLVPE